MESVLGVLLGSSVRAIVIAAAVALVLWGMRVKSPAVRHRAWTGVLVAMLFLPVLMPWAPKIPIPLLPSRSVPLVMPGGGYGPVGPDLSAPATLPAPVESESGSAYRLKVIPIAGALYLIGFGAFTARLLAGFVLSCRLSHRASFDARGFHRSHCSAPLTIGLLQPHRLLS